MKNFDLNKEIKHWKKQFSKYKAFKPSNVEELEDHLRSGIEDKMADGLSEEEAFHQSRKDTCQLPDDLAGAYDYQRDRRTLWQKGLLFNFIKVTLRNLNKRWSYSLTNIFGLIIGLSSVFVIGIYVLNELSYDRFHKNGEAIYRIVNEFDRTSGVLRYPLVPPAVAPTIDPEVSGMTSIQQVTRLRRTDELIFSIDGQEFPESNGFYADSAYLRMFSFDLISGNRSTALSTPNSIILTESLASEYFDDEDPIGKLITINRGEVLKVTGVMKDVPENSHIHFDFLISFSTYRVPEGYLADLSSWGWMGFLTYIQTNGKTNTLEIQNELMELYKSNNTSSANRDIKVYLQPLFDIYLGSNDLSNPDGGMFATNDFITIISLIGVAVLILFVAAFNYLNITTATLQTRYKEFGIRKVLGSKNSGMLAQLMSESAIITVISGMVGLVIAILTFQFGFEEINIAQFITPTFISLVVIGLMLFGAGLGLIVALSLGAILVSTQTLGFLKGANRSKSGRGMFKHTTLFIQYFISAGLVMVTLLIAKQIFFLQKKALGYTTEGVMVLSGTTDQVQNTYQRFKDKLSQHTGITGISLTTHTFDGDFSSSPMRLKSWPEDQAIQTAYYQVGFDFLKTIDIPLLQGRFFSRDIFNDSTSSVLINETAAKALQIKKVDNQQVIFTGGNEFEVIGIIKDFHYQSLHHEIGPLALIMPFTHPQDVLIAFRSNDLASIYSTVEEAWQEVSPDSDHYINIRFLDNELSQQYEKEKHFAQVVQSFAALAVIIACLGLWSLMTVAINLQIKQISIKKILGAESIHILINLGKTFLIVAFSGTILAWPVATYLSDLWLSSFAYHINPDISLLGYSIMIIMIISTITLAFQYLRITNTNPVKILQNE